MAAAIARFDSLADCDEQHRYRSHKTTFSKEVEFMSEKIAEKYVPTWNTRYWMLMQQADLSGNDLDPQLISRRFSASPSDCEECG